MNCNKNHLMHVCNVFHILKKALLILMLLIAITGIKNSIAQEVVGSSGISATSSEGSFHATVGQTVYYQNTSTSATEIQGVQQNYCYNPSDGGTISEDQTLCFNGDAALIENVVYPQGAVRPLEYKWQSSATNANSGFSDIPNTEAPDYNPGQVTQNTWYRRLARVTCAPDGWQTAAVSNVIEITVYNAFTPGAIEITGETIFYGGNPAEIGSDTDASGGDESITYAWYSSTDDFTNNSTLIAGAAAASYVPPTGLTETTSFRRYAKDGTCNTTFTVSAGTWKVEIAGLWTGADPNDNNWNTPGNWDDGQVPGTGVNVTIPQTGNDPVISVAAACQNITIENNSTLTINSSHTLNVTGDFTLNDGGDFTNNGTLKFSGSACELSDNRTVKSSLGDVTVAN